MPGKRGAKGSNHQPQTLAQARAAHLGICKEGLFEESLNGHVTTNPSFPCRKHKKLIFK